MRAFPILVITAAGLFAGSTAPAMAMAPGPSDLKIQVTQGDWGSARTADIQAVLESVAAVLAPYFPQRNSNQVVVAFNGAGPRVLFDKARDGAYVVFLNVKDTRWDQFAYQFSHELCHIFTNYEHRKANTETRDHQRHPWKY